MGSLLTIPASFIATCLGSASCQLLFACCPSFDGPMGTKFIYAIFLMVIAITQSIGMIPELGKILMKTPRLCPQTTNTTSFDDDGSHKNQCLAMAGYLFAYKICFGYFLFSLLMMLLCARITSKSSLRSKIHNYAHGLKFFVLSSFIIASFAIPTSNSLLTFIRIAGFTGGFLFIIVQLICVIDFAHLMNESWLERLEAGGSRWWFAAQLGVSLSSTVLLIVVYSLTLLMYGSRWLYVFLVTSNLIFALVATVVSVLPAVREYQPTTGLVQSSLVALYVSYLSWTAISSDPDSNFVGSNRISSNALLTLSLVLFIASVLYSVFSSTIIRRVQGSDDEHQYNEKTSAEMNDTPEYNYSYLHLLLLLACLYVTMTLTSWLKSTSDIHEFTKNRSAFWVKASSGWLCYAIYIWTCIAPCLMPDRDFS